MLAVIRSFQQGLLELLELHHALLFEPLAVESHAAAQFLDGLGVDDGTIGALQEGNGFFSHRLLIKIINRNTKDAIDSSREIDHLQLVIG